MQGRDLKRGSGSVGAGAAPLAAFSLSRGSQRAAAAEPDEASAADDDAAAKQAAAAEAAGPEMAEAEPGGGAGTRDSAEVADGVAAARSEASPAEPVTPKAAAAADNAAPDRVPDAAAPPAPPAPAPFARFSQSASQRAAAAAAAVKPKPEPRPLSSFLPKGAQLAARSSAPMVVAEAVAAAAAAAPRRKQRSMSAFLAAVKQEPEGVLPAAAPQCLCSITQYSLRCQCGVRRFWPTEAASGLLPVKMQLITSQESSMHVPCQNCHATAALQMTSSAAPMRCRKRSGSRAPAARSGRCQGLLAMWPPWTWTPGAICAYAAPGCLRPQSLTIPPLANSAVPRGRLLETEGQLQSTSRLVSRHVHFGYGDECSIARLLSHHVQGRRSREPGP